jgi:hypothetical protein
MNLKSALRALILLAVFITHMTSCATTEEKMWARYFQEKIGKNPRPLFLEALNLIPAHGRALSLGSGIGNDEVLLLKKGWSLDCVEGQKIAIDIMKERLEVKKNQNLIRFINKPFELIDEQELRNDYDFLYAGFSLPFVKEQDFFKLWFLFSSKVKTNGIFAGHFFGKNHKKLNTQITYLDKTQIETILKDFEILSLNEDDEHVFEVIAKKKGP